MNHNDPEEMTVGINNHVESYSRTLKMLLGVHPTIWTVSQEANRSAICWSGPGLSNTNSGRKSLITETNLQLQEALVRRFADLTPRDYLHTVAKIINQDF